MCGSVHTTKTKEQKEKKLVNKREIEQGKTLCYNVLMFIIHFSKHWMIVVDVFIENNNIMNVLLVALEHLRSRYIF